jgi:hypothetical protein
VGDENHKMDSHKKKIMALIVASTALGAIILCMLSFWIYHIKYSSKPNKKKFQTSGIFPLIILYLLII